jgi:hypothetical protein
MKLFYTLLAFICIISVVSCFNEKSKELCGTHIAWELKNKMKGKLKSDASCYEFPTCDTPSNRQNTNTNTIMSIPTWATVFLKSDGSYPDGVDETKVQQQITQLNSDFGPYGVEFTLNGTTFTKYQNQNCLPKYGISNTWYNTLMSMKNVSAHDPQHYLNIFISCQDPGTFGTLLGIGTFPWDEDALSNTGGLWLNSKYTGTGHKTATHEVGHNVGLWHTFHGVSEVSSLGSCYECPHTTDAASYDEIGDLCADTPATPTNYKCSNPSTSDGTPASKCSLSSWGSTDYSNFMSYSPDSCMNHFTECQEQRAHCYLQTKLASYFS